MLYGNTLSVIANVISLSLLSALSFDTNTSVVFSLLYSAYSYLSSPVFMMIDYVEKKAIKQEEKMGSGRKAMLIVFPVLITVIFFLMYRSSSSLFDALAAKINWNFISWSWIVFTAGGLCLLYGFYYQKRIDGMDSFDAGASNNLVAGNFNPTRFFGREISIADENFSGTLLFALLNILLLIVNVLDIDFMFGNQKLPLGVSPKQYVHQGTNMLITSIVVAIAIILYYFRGGLNFYNKNKAIKVLACLWVVQNAFMLFSTTCRNNLYITEYGLTYKRIGVYVYLLLTLIGLITTLIKIWQAKTNMYLFRKNGWLFYSLLIILAFPDWDKIVTSYNVKKFNSLDTVYLLSLSNSVLPGLLPYYSNSGAREAKGIDSINQHNSLNGANVPDQVKPIIDSLGYRGDFQQAYCRRLYNVLYEYRFNNWLSWNHEDMSVYNTITSKDFTDKVHILNFSEVFLTNESFKLLSIFNQVTDLRLHFTQTISVKQFACFPNLKRLDLRYNSIEDLSGIEIFKDLEYIDLHYNNIYDFSPLYKLKNLKELYIGNIKDEEFKKLCEELPNTHVERFKNI